MAEVKTGLEGIVGWINETGTLGKVYYNGVVGSAGTQGCGVGTAATTGMNRVYWGSGFVNCSGVWVHVAQGTVVIGSGDTVVECKNVEVGSDGVVTIVEGAGAANVAAAIAARTGTTAGKTPLAYVTLGTSGSVLSGSIVDERSFHTATPIGYVTGFEYSIDENKKDVYSRATFAHYKAGRKIGKLSVKELYVNHGSFDVWPTSSTYHTVPTIGVELAVNDIAGTIGESLLFQRCGKDSTSVGQPEDDLDSAEISANFGSMSRFA